MSNPFGEAGTAQYVYFTTYKKDGTAVGTPVWAALDGDAMVIWSATDTWKVKRARRNPQVTVAKCDSRGGKRGQEYTGTAEILDPAGTDHVRAVLAKKYGIVGRIAVYGSRYLRGRDHSIGIRVTAA